MPKALSYYDNSSPDHNPMSKVTEVMNLLSSYTPILEQNSIDEAWLDMTGCERLFVAY